MRFVGIFVMNLIILSAEYITVGEFIWKCESMQSVKANIVWIIVYAIFTGYALTNPSTRKW